MTQLAAVICFCGKSVKRLFTILCNLNALVVHIPFLITLVAGDLLAGEATAGTYRILVTRPVSRFKIVFSKFFEWIDLHKFASTFHGYYEFRNWAFSFRRG
ncbi:MAG: ABC transporter permease [Ignavibacteriales bacterium]|nr:ABC transporter permease [Ignavibacteriales bacterium]